MKWRLIKFVDNSAIIENENGQTINWPHDLLPTDYSIGDEFEISFSKEDKANSGYKAKQIINTILQSE